MTHGMIRRLARWLILVCGLVIPLQGGALRYSAAQDSAPNLLVNGELESPYYAQQGTPTRSVPNGWALWVNRGEPASLPHSAAPQSRDGSVTWLLGTADGTFMAAGYQRVEGVNAGDMLHLTAAGWLFTCDNPDTRCVVPGSGTPRSTPTAVAALQVGIDPSGGTNPLATTVRWSAPASPYDRWHTLSVTVTAESDAVTVFLYMTQSSPVAINNAYWDHVALVRVAEDDPTPAPMLPVTLPQGPQPDGGVVHVVQAVDTLDRIAAAYAHYGVTVDGIIAANGLDAAAPGVNLGQSLVLLPPGSVDPVSGWLLVDGATVTPTAAPSATHTPPPTATETPAPTDTPPPTATSTPLPTATDLPTATPTPTAAPSATHTPLPSATATPAPTATPLPTDAPSPTLTATDIPTTAPSATLVPTGVPTDVPTTAPAATEVAVVSAGDLLATGTVCVTLFDDRDADSVQDLSERGLVGAVITMQNAAGAQTLAVDNELDPVCFTLAPGSYTLSAVPGDGYALTSPSPLQVVLVGGQRLRVRMGAAEGYTPLAPNSYVAVPTPVPNVSGSTAPFYGYTQDDSAEDDTIFDQIYDISGWILLILAVGLVVGGNWLLGVLRRRE